MTEDMNIYKDQDPTPEGKSGRTFTQDDVNHIVSDRLSREREKITAQVSADAEKREQALKAREARLECRDYLDTEEYPVELLDVLDSSDATGFKSTVKKLIEVFPQIAQKQGKKTYSGWTPGSPTTHSWDLSGTSDKIAEAFKPK